MEKGTRKNTVKVRLSDEEKNILDQKYSLSNKRSREAFLRQLILNDIFFNADPSSLREYNTHLAQIAYSLNQIARRVNAGGSIYAEDIAEMKKKMGQIWQIQKPIRSKNA